MDFRQPILNGFRMEKNPRKGKRFKVLLPARGGKGARIPQSHCWCSEDQVGKETLTEARQRAEESAHPETPQRKYP